MQIDTIWKAFNIQYTHTNPYSHIHILYWYERASKQANNRTNEQVIALTLTRQYKITTYNKTIELEQWNIKIREIVPKRL